MVGHDPLRIIGSLVRDPCKSLRDPWGIRGGSGRDPDFWEPPQRRSRHSDLEAFSGHGRQGADCVFTSTLALRDAQTLSRTHADAPCVYVNERSGQLCMPAAGQPFSMGLTVLRIPS